METSQNIDLLASALAKAQGGFGAAAKDAENPHLRNKFGTLDSLIRATRPALAANGLAVIQSVGISGGTVEVTTMLAHSSGQWVRATASAPTQEQKGVNPLQAVGVVVSYLRRYAYGAMVGVVASDDTDGESVPAPRAPDAPLAPVQVDYMPQERFADLLPRWAATGKNADEIAAFCAGKGTPLSPQQTAELSRAIAEEQAAF